jgi:hypothetical protein
VLDQMTRLDSYVRSRIEAALVKEHSKAFASHPSDGERLRLAREARAPGLVDLPGSATDLLGNFAALAVQVTTLHYAEDLRLPVSQGVLFDPAGAFVAADRKDLGMGLRQSL